MWILYAVIGAFGKAFTSYYRKKLAHTNPSIYIFISSLLVSLVVFVCIFFLDHESVMSAQNAPLLLAAGALVQAAAGHANLYAFKHEELSYITPMFALTPLYAALIAYLAIDEVPSVMGLSGIGIIVIGVYVVTSKKGVTLAETFRHIIRNKGAKVGMLIPIGYAIVSTVNKKAINEGVDPLVSVAIMGSIIAVLHVYVLFFNGKEIVGLAKNRSLLKLISFASFFALISIAFATLALEDGLTGYTVAIRRLDVLITVILGWKFMQDKDFSRRLIGAIIITIGVFLVSIG